jgi:parvulin-like peptidyl-prolyl isomerase
MRDRIAGELPETADQVHARQILAFEADAAQAALARLQAGADFEALAAEYDPVTGGDLGWFPQGYLLDPGLEAAAFALQPGTYSDVLQSPAGYHILQVVERDPERPLTPDARLVLQGQAVEEWLAGQRQAAQIEILLP